MMSIFDCQHYAILSAEGVDYMPAKYTTDQRQDVITRFSSGESVTVLSETTGIPRSTIYAWIKQNREKTQNNHLELSLKNFRLLESKVKRLEGIISILQAVNCTVQAPLSIRLNEIEKLYGQYSVHILCDALRVDRGTFYNHIKRNKRDHTWYAKRKEDLRIKIQQIYDDSKQIFGAAKITAVLKEQGEHISEQMVRSLMRDMGLTSIRQDAKDLYDKERLKYKNFLNQQFSPNMPNEVWVSDVTFFRYKEQNYYICVIIDLFARMVVGYRIGKRNSTQLVTRTFKAAYLQRSPSDGLLFHTDRGTNYRANAFEKCLKDHNVTHSFSRAYVPYDNSVMESFFSSLKREELYRTNYRSEKEFRTAVDNYITFYNTKRPHAKNKYKTPEAKEQESCMKCNAF